MYIKFWQITTISELRSFYEGVAFIIVTVDLKKENISS
jgi:hypothetical protein